MEHLGLEAGEASVHQNGVEISRRRRLAQRGLLYSCAVCVARARAKSDEKRQCPGGWIAFQCSGWMALFPVWVKWLVKKSLFVDNCNGPTPMLNGYGLSLYMYMYKYVYIYNI